MNAAQPVIVFNTVTGQVIQRYVPTTLTNGTFASNSTGSFNGIAYSADGSKLLFSQDNNFVAVANVDPFSGLLTPAYSVTLPPPPANPNLYNSVSANAGGVVVADGSLGLVALNANNTVGVINLFNGTLLSQIPVGNAPNSIVVKGNFAYVSNEGGRPANDKDFTNLSDGTPIVVDPTDAFATTGTVSVINLHSGKVVSTINVGLHPAGMAISGSLLFVANSYSDTISVIDTDLQQVIRTIDVGVPIKGGAFGAGANGIAVVGTIAYVTLGQSNAIAAIDLTNDSKNAVLGYIPTAYFPTSIAYDKGTGQLVVCDDKGIGAQGSIGTSHGVSGFNTHQETGTVSLIPIPSRIDLAKMTEQVITNNHWNSDNIQAGPKYADINAKPVAIPAHIGEPSLIKHVFLIIKENRTYDQMLGDLPQGNGDPDLAVFAANVPNQHALVKRFPLLDNMYAPSRQSADGHPWIVESGSFYSNDILSPDWIRSYPGGNSNDALTYTQKGFLWSGAEKMGLNVAMYGEWSGGYTINTKSDGTRYSWADFYNTSLFKETGGQQGSMVVPDNSDTEIGDHSVGDQDPRPALPLVQPGDSGSVSRRLLHRQVPCAGGSQQGTEPDDHLVAGRSHQRDDERQPAAQQLRGRQRPGTRAHRREHQQQQGVAEQRHLRRGRRQPGRRRPRRWPPSARLYHQPLYGRAAECRCRQGHSHDLHAGKHQPHDREHPRLSASDAVRSDGLAHVRLLPEHGEHGALHPCAGDDAAQYRSGRNPDRRNRSGELRDADDAHAACLEPGVERDDPGQGGESRLRR